VPKVVVAQTSLTGGEISPRLLGRPDLKQYAAAAKTAENVIVLEQGGVRGKPGTDFLESAKFADRTARLIPFIVSPTLGYDLEFGDLYMRVWKGATRVAFELVTPFTPASLPTLDYTQGGDTMFIASATLPIYRLLRFAEDSWTLEVAPFDPVPFGEVGTRLAVIVTLSLATVGAGRTATAASATWNRGDIGRRITLSSGRALITAYTSTTIVTVTIEQAFASVTLGASLWVLTGSPQTAISPSAGEVGTLITLTAQVTSTLEGAKAITALTEAAGTATATATAHGYSTGDTVIIAGNDLAHFNTTAAINVISANQFTYAIFGVGPVAVLGVATRSLPVAAGEWRSGDVGRYVKLNGGLVKITALASPAVANARVTKKLDSNIAAAPSSWQLLDAVWNANDGYPATVTLFEQRLWAAGTAKQPGGLWGSRSGLYYDFTIGVLDDDALAYEIASDEVNPIAYLNSGKELVAFTYGPAFVVRGGVEKPITPTNISIKPHTSYGTAAMRPESVGNAVLFAQKGGKKLRSFEFDLTKDGYRANDIGAFSEHILRRGLVALSVQAMPESIVWVLLADGTLAALTYSEEQQVVAFTRCPTDGFVESICTTPDGSTGNDMTKALVRRTINGATVRYVEKLNFSAYQDSRMVIAQAASATVSGLSHLNGKTVSAVAEGIYLGVFLVAGGQITLPRAATSISVGLPFVPTLELLPPDFGSGAGSSQGQANSQHRVHVRVNATVGCTVNGQELPGFQNYDGALLDAAPVAVTGLLDISEFGWSADAPLVLTQPRPYPWEVLEVIRAMTSNAG